MGKTLLYPLLPGKILESKSEAKYAKYVFLSYINFFLNQQMKNQQINLKFKKIKFEKVTNVLKKKILKNLSPWLGRIRRWKKSQNSLFYLIGCQGDHRDGKNEES